MYVSFKDRIPSAPGEGCVSGMKSLGHSLESVPVLIGISGRRPQSTQSVLGIEIHARQRLFVELFKIPFCHPGELRIYRSPGMQAEKMATLAVILLSE